jgi:RNA polymerase sigma-70 factor, ECF subfamily
VSDPERDEELVRRFLGGDAAAFSTLLERHESRVYGLCLRILGDPDDARDAAQDTFLIVLRKLDRFRGDAAFTTWLHRVTVNACYDELRKRKRRPILHVATGEGDASPHEAGPPVTDPTEGIAGSLDTAAALARVPEDFRIALVLADVQDLPYEEIAHVLDVPIGTVKSRVHRGRIALARAMGLGTAGAGGEPSGGTGSSEDER